MLLQSSVLDHVLAQSWACWAQVGPGAILPLEPVADSWLEVAG